MSAAELEIGKPAPSFTLQDQDGNKVSLSEYRGKWVVLYFYPKDDTPGCTMEAQDFSDMMAEFEAAAAGVHIHGAAAGLVGHGLIADDIISTLPRVLDRLEQSTL